MSSKYLLVKLTPKYIKNLTQNICW